MAKKITVNLVDDLDAESRADETVEFGIDGVNYEIDLTSGHAEQLRTQIGHWTARARKVGGGRRTRRHTGRSGLSKEKLAQVRAWAREHGHVVADRGRIPAELLDAFNAANP
ncbi:Protein lsr2 precursor [Mycobacteroides abscessus subsp. abscessus]|uniref:histone-like nucleoid-structuring protein Lsr2 n=1 Tax=Mycobacteroides abscessus TaxID=36809 RepID=UPI0009A8215A|nr:Lsr2 family protein [Mycobacteroides abscessus]SKO34904.1 Protein lsr2 precursor [Mycobacteroides abscessus subsp. abscessus]